MTDNITLRRAVGERIRNAMQFLVDALEYDHDIAALAALDAALKEPEPKPVVVEQLFALAKLTVRRAADPDPWVWDRLEDDGTWKPFNPLIHGPDMWRLEQALRAALSADMSATGDDCRQPATEPDATREPATVEQVIAAHGPSWGASATADFFTGFRAAERFHGIRARGSK